MTSRLKGKVTDSSHTLRGSIDGLRLMELDPDALILR